MIDKKPNVVQLALVAALALVLGACDADSPTEPQRTPNPPPPTSATSSFAITVSVSPRTIEAGSGEPVTVTVSAVRTDNNQPVPRDSTALLTTTSGTLTNAAGTTGTAVAIVFDVNGRAQATANPEVTAVIRAQIEQSFGQATVTVTDAPEVTPFSLFGVSPNFGPPAGGTEVRIEGAGISLPTEVVFGGIPVQPLSISANVIRVRTPPIDLPSGQNRTVSVTVNINVGEEDPASDTLGSAFTYTRNESPVIPKIISVTPTSGPNEGGTQVTIIGEAFGSEVQVFFGATSRVESRILSLSSTRIVVETPPATGQNSGNRDSTVDVRVVDLNSGFEATLGGAFLFGLEERFISSVRPTEGTYFGGTLVTIFGAGFEAPVAVEFGRNPPLAQQPVSVSGTEIVARSVPIEIVGCARPSGAIRVINVETGDEATNSSGLSFTYRPVEPEIGSVFPNSTTVDVVTGAIVAGSPTTTTITGGGFDRQGRPPVVTFGGERSGGVAITSLDPDPLHEGHGVGDEMSVDIPGFFGEFAEEDCTTSGGLEGQRYTETRVDVVVTARDTGCSATLANGFTYFPDDTSCRATAAADFSVTVSGRTVTVRDLSGGSPTSLRWDFGDGTVENGSPGETRTHTYANPGTYTIELTAVNAEGSNSASQTVTIIVPPTANFSFTLAGSVVTVTDISTGSPTRVLWDFGDGTGSESGVPGESRSHTYAAAGTYTITLTASNTAGADTATKTVTIPP